jgi:hypothetical protein
MKQFSIKQNQNERNLIESNKIKTKRRKESIKSVVVVLKRKKNPVFDLKKKRNKNKIKNKIKMQSEKHDILTRSCCSIYFNIFCLITLTKLKKIFI